MPVNAIKFVTALSILHAAWMVSAQSTTVYTYDELGRLTAASEATGNAQVFGYDSAGNRTTTTSSAATASAFQVNDISATEGAAFTFAVTRTGVLSASQAVTFQTASGTAIAGTDFTATSGTLTFAPGEFSKPIPVSVIDDTLSESSETFTLQLSGATGGATIARATGTATIIDNDALPLVTATNPGYSLNSSQVIVISLNSLAATGGQAATIQSFTPATGNGTASIAGDGSSVTYTARSVPRAPFCEPSIVVDYTVPYSIRTTSSGAIANGLVSFSVTGQAGGQPPPGVDCN